MFLVWITFPATQDFLSHAKVKLVVVIVVEFEECNFKKSDIKWSVTNRNNTNNFLFLRN